MPQAVREREVLLDSKNPGSMTPALRVGTFLLGLLLLGDCLYDAFHSENTFRGTFSKLFIGVVCVCASGFRKTIYLAPEGIVRRTRGWFSTGEEILPWSQIRHVTLAFRKDDMLALFEKGTMGWKVPCRRQDEEALRRILKERIPDTEIETLGR